VLPFCSALIRNIFFSISFSSEHICNNKIFFPLKSCLFVHNWTLDFLVDEPPIAVGEVRGRVASAEHRTHVGVAGSGVESVQVKVALPILRASSFTGRFRFRDRSVFPSFLGFCADEVVRNDAVVGAMRVGEDNDIP